MPPTDIDVAEATPQTTLEVRQESAEVNWRTALFLARCADLAYSVAPDRTALDRGAAELGLSASPFYSSPDNQFRGFVGVGRKNGQLFRVLSFRGTWEAGNWIANLDYRQEAWFGAELHKGFSDAWGSLWFNLRTALSNAGAADAPLWITGHSLGGALATLASWRLATAAELGFAAYLRPTYTFGCPRVGGPKFAADYAARTTQYRVIHIQDPVPHVPPSVITLGGTIYQYEHVGILYVINPRYPNIIYAEDPQGRTVVDWNLTDVANRVRAAFDSVLNRPTILAHRMSEYVSAISAFL
jgi:triacylglycerol lipase